MIKASITFKRKDLEKLVKKEVLTELLEDKNDILTSMKLATPVDTGEAKSSWKLLVKNEKLSLENDENYIFYVNNGTSKIQPRNFIERVCLSFGKIEGSAARLTQ
jgi:hypothetical protein